MKLGFILFLLGSALILYLMRIKFEKEALKRIGITIGVLMLFYGLILLIQPKDDKYVKFTKTTISKTLEKNESK